MSTSEIILYFSVALWLVPPLRQWRTDYRYFFLVLALSDPLRLAVFHTFGSWPGFLTLPLAILQLASLFFIRKLKFHYWIIIVVFITISGFITPKIVYEIVASIIHITIFLVLFIRFAKALVAENILNLYLMFIIAYQLSTILKYITAILDLNTGIYYFQITTIFQILFGLFFSLIARWQIKLDTDLDQFNHPNKLA